MKSKAFVRILCALFLFALSLVHSLSFGQVRFREFREDAARFEQYLERAKDAQSETEFESVVKHAHAFFAAAWERDAELKISEVLRKDGEGAREKLEQDKLSARAAWEKDAEAVEAKVRGSFLARREAIVSVEFDKAFLREALLSADASAKDFSGTEKLSIWDAALAPKAAEIAARWEEKLAQTLAAIRARGDALDAASRAAFEKEVASIEKELRARFRLEKNNLIYKERNKIIRDELLDLKSLRAASERGKASTVADEILARTIEALEARKTALLADPSSPEGASAADFSNLGENWEARLRELVESGLSIWRSAQQEFLANMASWKAGAEEAFRQGDDAWRSAYEKLARAQESWQKDLQNEINAGLEAWKTRDEELSKELERAKADLNSYLSTTDASWEEYAKGAYQTLFQGASIHGEALGNIEWLGQMVERYSKQGSLGVPEFWSNFNDWIVNGPEYSRRQELLKKILIDENKWDASWASVTAVFKKSDYDSANDSLIEYYEVTAYQWSGWGWFFSPVSVGTFAWEHVISDNSPEEEKNPAFYYRYELSRWQMLRDEFAKLVSDAERAVHNAVMLGDGGPGFLRNIAGGYGLNPDGESDPYLMTAAELEFALARRERDYYAKRLEIAKAVLEYATAEGPREGAEATVARKDAAEKLRNDARALYEARLAEVKDLTETMARIKGIAGDADFDKSIAYLTGELSKKKGALAAAEEEYRRFSEALAVLENGESADYLTRQLYLAQSEYLGAEKEYRKKREEYFSKLRTAEGVERTAAYVEEAAEALRGYVAAKDLYDGFSAIVSDEIDDENLEIWGELLFADANAFLWEGREDAREFIHSLYAHYLLAPGDGEAKDAFIEGLHAEREVRKDAHDAAKMWVEEKLAASTDDARARAANFEPALVQYVEEAFGGRITFNEMFEGWSFDDFKTASEQAVKYVEKALSENQPVSRSMHALSQELEALSRELTSLLYVRDHASDNDFREVYAAREARRAACEKGFNAVEEAMGYVEAYESGKLGASALMSKMIADYDALDDAAHEFLAQPGLAAAGEYGAFIEDARELLRTRSLFADAQGFLETGGAINVDEYLAAITGDESYKAALRAIIAEHCLDDEGHFLSGDALYSAYLEIADMLDAMSEFAEEEARDARDIASKFIIEVGDVLAGYQREEYNAKKLVEYHDNPSIFASYRNFLANMTRQGDDGSGTAGAAYSLASLNWKNPFGGGIIDQRDGEGVIATSFFGDADAEGRMLESMLIDASNRAAGLLKDLLAAARPQMQGEEKTAEDYRSALEAMYQSGDLTDLDALCSEAFTLKSARGIDSLKALEGEMDTLYSALSSQKLRMGDLAKSAGVLAEVGGDAKALRAKWQEAAAERNDRQKEFADLSAKLAARQKDYTGATNAYLAKMNEVAGAYTQYKDAEFGYEKAYAVWEYAHTPYLMDTVAKDAQTGEGELPTGDREVLGSLDPADARERYKSALEAYEKAEEKYQTKKAAMDSQERVEDLATDDRYRTLREDFKTEAESFARIARAATLIDEETKKLSMEVEFWEKQYKAAKENTSGFVKFHYDTDGTTKVFDEMTDEEISMRDVIVGRMVEHANEYGMEALLDVFKEENRLYSQVVRFETEYVDVQDPSCAGCESCSCPSLRMLRKNYDPAGYVAALAAYNAFNPQFRRDLAYLREHGMNYELIDKLARNWRSFNEWKRKYHEACEELSDCGRFNYYCKRKWKRKRNHREDQMGIYETAYKSFRTTLTTYLTNIQNARNNLKEKSEKLASLDRVRSVDEFRATTFARADLSLAESDRARIYDGAGGSGDINISALRRKLLRADIDGRPVEVMRVGNTLKVLDREGTEIGSYAINDASVLVATQPSIEGAFNSALLEEGAKGYLVDYVYSAREVSAVMKETGRQKREEKRSALESYASASSHEGTIILRDLEALYADLLVSSAKVGGSYENRPRRYEGYALAVSDFLYGEGNVSGRVVKALVSQQKSFQEQDWDFTIKTYQQKKKEWMEAVTFIKTRSERDWAEGLYGVQQAWRKWRIETRGKIAEGEEKWNAARTELEETQKKWAAETALGSAAAASKMLGKDIEAEIRNTVAAINAKLPGNIALAIDAEKIYADAMKHMPKADLGALAQSMTNVSATFGISEVMNLGLSGTMYTAFGAKMQEFESAMKVMRTLHLGEAVLSMMTAFEEQLTGANKGNYETVLTGLAANIAAPFQRDEKARQWTIRVITDHSLVSTTYRTRRFEDYKDYVNTTVKLKDIRTLGGGVINFNNPATYNMLDADELEMYVALETDHLKREIDRVFTGGDASLFGAHSKKEFDRLQKEFTDKYTEYMEGQAMLGMGWYRTPIVPNGPDPMTVAKVGACFAGPWAAFAVTALMLTVDAHDGLISGKHALTQGAVGFASGLVSTYSGGLGSLVVNVAASGIDYEESGGIGWDNDKFREGAIRSVVSYALNNTLNGALDGAFGAKFSETVLGTGLSAGISGFVMSGVEITSTGWGDLDLDFNKKNWREHLAVGVASGVGAMVSKTMSGSKHTGSEKAQYPDSNTLPEGWGGVFTGAGAFDPMNAFTMKALTGGINSLIMTGMYHAFDGKGFSNDYSRMNWQNMTMSAYDLGNFAGGQANAWVKAQAARADEALKNKRSNGDPRVSYDSARQDDIRFFERAAQWLSKGFEYLDAADKAIKGAFTDLGEIAGTWLSGLSSLALEGMEALGNGVASLWNGAKDALAALWDGVRGVFDSERSNEPKSLDEMLIDPEMQELYVMMNYDRKNFAKIAKELELNDEMIQLGKDLRKEDALKTWEKAIDPKNIVKNGGKYEITLGDAKIVFDSKQVECGDNCKNMSLTQMLKKMDSEWAVALYEMVLENDIKKIDVTSIVYESPKYTGHDTGQSLDITSMTFDNGTVLNFRDLTNKIPESDNHKELFDWFRKNNEIIMDAYSPWWIFKQSGETEAIDVRNNWSRYKESVYTNRDNNYEYRMWTHRHHLHLRIK